MGVSQKATGFERISTDDVYGGHERTIITVGTSTEEGNLS